MRGRAHVVMEAGKGEVGDAGAAADGVARFEHQDRSAQRASSTAAARPFGPEPITTAS